MKSKTIAVVLAVLLVCGVCRGQLQVYPAGTAAAITVVSNTIKKTGAYDIYNANPRGPRMIRPTVHFKISETGTNTTHYWAQIDFYINKSSSDTALTDWSPVHTNHFHDWSGYADTEQNSFVLACPWMDSYNFRYFYMDIHYPYGVVADSTDWTIYLVGDKGQNAPQLVPNTTKKIDHYKLFGEVAAQVINGGVTITSETVDLRIERIPGIYQMPDRGCLVVRGDGVKVESNTLTFETVGVFPGFAQSVFNLNTLRVPISLSGSGSAMFFFTLSDGSGFTDAVRFNITDEGAADTTGFYAEIYLECDP